MKKILVPTDFSKPAEWALETATQIALKANAQMILLHVVELPGPDSFNAEGQITIEADDWEEKIFSMKLIESSKNRLNEAAKHAEAAGAIVTCELMTGNAFRAMRSVIAEKEIDLVVMGTSGRSKFEEVIVGSNTERIVRHAKCPVLTVHEKPSAKSFANIVYATSMSDRELDFADVVKNAQEMYKARVHLVRINTPMNFQPDHVSMRIMKEFARKTKLNDFTVNVFNDRTEEEGILHFSNMINADLIALATHGRTGFAHVLVGSIAEDVVNHSVKPVLTYLTHE